MGRIRNTQEKTTKQITVRLTDTLYNRIEAEADRQSRPMANMVKAILESYFEDIDRVKRIAEK